MAGIETKKAKKPSFNENIKSGKSKDFMMPENAFVLMGSLSPHLPLIRRSNYLEDFFYLFTPPDNPSLLCDEAAKAAFQFPEVIGVGYGLNTSHLPCFKLLVKTEVCADEKKCNQLKTLVAEGIISYKTDIDTERCKEFIEVGEMIELPSDKELTHGGNRFSFTGIDGSPDKGTITCLLNAEMTITMPGQDPIPYNRHYAMTCAHCILPGDPKTNSFKDFDKKTKPDIKSICPFSDLAWTELNVEEPPQPPQQPPQYHVSKKIQVIKVKDDDSFDPECLFRANYPWIQQQAGYSVQNYRYQHPPIDETSNPELEMKYLCSRFGVYPEKSELPRMCLNYGTEYKFQDDSTACCYTLDVGILDLYDQEDLQACSCKQSVPGNVQLALEPERPIANDSMVSTIYWNQRAAMFHMRSRLLQSMPINDDIKKALASLIVLIKHPSTRQILNQDCFIDIALSKFPEIKDNLEKQNKDSKDQLTPQKRSIKPNYKDDTAKQNTNTTNNSSEKEQIVILNGEPQRISSESDEDDQNDDSISKSKDSKNQLTPQKGSIKPNYKDDTSKQNTNTTNNSSEKEQTVILNAEPERISSESDEDVQNDDSISENCPLLLKSDYKYTIPDHVQTDKQKPEEISLSSMKNIWRSSRESDFALKLKLVLVTKGEEMRIRKLENKSFYFELITRHRLKPRQFVKLPVIIFKGPNQQEGTEQKKFTEKGVSGSPLFLTRDDDEEPVFYFLGNVCGENTASRYDVAINSVAPQIYYNLMESSKRDKKCTRSIVGKVQPWLKDRYLEQESRDVILENIPINPCYLTVNDQRREEYQVIPASQDEQHQNVSIKVNLKIRPCLKTVVDKFVN